MMFLQDEAWINFTQRKQNFDKKKMSSFENQANKTNSLVAGGGLRSSWTSSKKKIIQYLDVTAIT